MEHKFCGDLTAYHFQVYQYASLADGGYRLETNHGPKRVTIWTNQVLLAWAFQWREILTNQGYRQVDRFIRTKTGQGYAESAAGYIVVQDLFSGENIELNDAVQVKQLGYFVGKWFQACEQALQQISTDKSLPKWPVQVSGNKQFSDIELDNTLADSMFTYLVKQYWPSIKKRLRQAQILEQASQTNQQSRFYPEAISLGQWLYLEQGYVGFYTISQGAVHDLISLAKFMQFLYIEQGLSLGEIESFYTSFAEAYQADTTAHYNILAHLIYPHHLVDIISKYINQMVSPEESAEEWLEACGKQDKFDQLHLWLANYLDQGKPKKGLG